MFVHVRGLVFFFFLALIWSPFNWSATLTERHLGSAREDLDVGVFIIVFV